MPRIAWRAAGAIVVAASAVGLRYASLVPWRLAAARDAQVRLSWSARPERVERCRRLSDEELAKLPAHMRLRLQCEGTFARYLLTVRVDSLVISADTLRGGGLRHDRPLHLYEEIPVPRGERRVRVEVVRLDSTTTVENDVEEAPAGAGADTLLGVRAGREEDERMRRGREAMPPHLAFDTTLSLPAGSVLLVVYDEPTRRLTAVGERQAPAR